MTGVSASSVAEVLDLYEAWGDDRYDEEVTQVDHALQTAALAEACGASAALIVASLLHDVGHLLALRDTAGHGQLGGDDHHDDSGAAWLRPLFGPAVSAPVALHVRAKRYLCAADATYADWLSVGSVRSLDRQGGPMPAAELRPFEAATGFTDALQLREWDDAAKRHGLLVLPLAHYRNLLEELGTSCP